MTDKCLLYIITGLFECCDDGQMGLCECCDDGQMFIIYYNRIVWVLWWWTNVYYILYQDCLSVVMTDKCLLYIITGLFDCCDEVQMFIIYYNRIVWVLWWWTNVYYILYQDCLSVVMTDKCLLYIITGLFECCDDGQMFIIYYNRIVWMLWWRTNVYYIL